MELRGFISLHRKIIESEIWQQKPFDKPRAWIDLLLRANHAENFVFATTVKRGEMITSEVALSERWGWSRTKVRAFLKYLETEKMVVQKKDTKKTYLTICNYESYQDTKTDKKTSKKHQKNTNNNVNNENKEETIKDESFIVRTPLQKFIIDHLPNVRRLEQQLTFEQAEKLIAEHDKKAIQTTLEQMENFKPLLTKYKSVYLTLKNWIKNENVSRISKPTSGGNTYNDRINLDIEELTRKSREDVKQRYSANN